MSQGDRPEEPVSFEDLYAQHGARVLRILARLGVPEDDCEDVAQEVWTTVHRALASYDPRHGTARAWIAGITRNEARSHRRAEGRRREDPTPEVQEPPELHVEGADRRIAAAHRQQVIWRFFEGAIPNEDHREAWMLHEVEELTVKEVATATGTRMWTAQWRIRMARSKLKAAQEKLTDEERERMRAVILPLGGVDGLLQALRDAPVSEEQLSRVWDRVTDRIEGEGGSVHDRLGAPDTAPSTAPPKRYTFTGRALASGAAVVFVLGALSGAAVHAELSPPRAVSVTTIEAEIAPPPRSSTIAPPPEPPRTARAAPSTTASIKASAWEPERVVLERARTALMEGLPQRALDQANEHARLFPRSSAAAAREEIAIRALVELGRRAAAEERAVNLVRWAPQRRPAMESMLGRSFL